MRPSVPSGLETLTALETVFFGVSLIILLFLLLSGGQHKDTRKLSAKLAEEKAAKEKVELEHKRKESLYGQFPESWNQGNGQYDVPDVPAADIRDTRMVTDINGFPSDMSIASLRSSGSGSPRPNSSPAEGSFNPSHSDTSRLTKHATAMLKTIGGVLASAPGALLNVPHALMGEKRVAAGGGDSGNPFDNEPLSREEDGTFVNINAYNLASTVGRLIDSSEVVKRGKLYTLGAHKRDERSPSVKERDFTMTGFFLSYYDKYGMKREFALRNTTVSKHLVRATSGAVDGMQFYAICVEHGVHHILLGSAEESCRDDWYDAFVDQVKRIKQQEIENDGEEEEWRHRSLPSKSEMAMLNPIAVNNTLESLENLGNIRRRFQVEPESVPIGRRRNSIQAKVNAPPIVNPLHPFDDDA